MECQEKNITPVFSCSAACPERSRGADLFTLFTPNFEGNFEGLPLFEV